MGTVIVGIIVLAIAGGAAYSLHRGLQPLWRTLPLEILRKTAAEMRYE